MQRPALPLSALFLFAALPLAGCPEKTQEAALPPAGLAGGGAAGGGVAGASAGAAVMPGAPGAGAGMGMATGLPGAAAANPHQAAAPAANPHAAAPQAPAHPPMGTLPGAASPGAASQPAHATVIPGGGGDAAAAAAELSGTVAEAHHVKEYTYIRVTAGNGSESWAAILKDESIGVGTKISLGKDVWMSDFQSPSLGKTFDRILFGRVLSKQ